MKLVFEGGGGGESAPALPPTPNPQRSPTPFAHVECAVYGAGFHLPVRCLPLCLCRVRCVGSPPNPPSSQFVAFGPSWALGEGCQIKFQGEGVAVTRFAHLEELLL